MGAMPDTMQPAPLPSVYQLRVVVRGVSPLIWRRLLIPADTTIAGLHAGPLIWRRLLIPADTTIAGLHAVLQVAFGWTGTHLHRFVVQGREYGIGYVGGPSFGDDPRRVRLGDLGLRRTERFTYHYDFTAGWCLDLRVEEILVDEPGRHVPGCTGGRRAGPPEDCGGVQAFLENTQAHHVLAAAIRAAEILDMLLDDEDVPRFGEHRDELAALLPLLGVNRFDRRTLNRALAALSATGARAA
jgi:Plasmid pRiA4b ORF-3-like protein